MIPSAFAAFPDPDTDPRHYLVRYYTEPDYQEWFDKNYPNDTIEHKVGYSKKIVTDDYYVNSLFEFAMKKPSGYYEIDEKAQTIYEDQAGLVSVRFGGYDEQWSGFIMHYTQDDRNELAGVDLLQYYTKFPANAVGTSEEGISVHLKVDNETWEKGNVLVYPLRDIIRYEYSFERYYSSNYWFEELQGIKHEKKGVIVIFLYASGDKFTFIFDTPQEVYSKDVKEFNKIIDSFWHNDNIIGETEKLSDLLEDYAPELKSAAAEPSGGCGEGTVLVNGVCQLAPEKKSAAAEPSGGCGQGTVLVKGVCELAPTQQPTQQSSQGCGPGTIMVNGVCELDEKTESSSMSIEPLYIIIAVVAIGGIIGAIAVARRGSKTSKPAKQELEEYEEKYIAKQKPAKQKPAEKKETSAFCENCGKSLKPEAMFCGKCGAPRS